jgi:bifunctional non-homologous end joining protein LigD
MPLKEYRKKRNFEETPEPGGRKTRRARMPPIFVIQKHAASRLHYDFRLEIEGVLASWAVPKGPSMNTAERRLAMRTEDHPIEYADFEGIIPEGHYGAGAVMVWDRGTYEVDDDRASAAEQLSRGELKFTLAGQKLHGGFVLVRADEKRWFLIKRRDEYAVGAWNIDRDDRSALTARTMRQIRQDTRVNAPVH